MAEAFYEQNNLDSSLYYYKEITNLNRVDGNIQAEAQYKVAELYLEKGQIQDAIGELQKVRHYSPNTEIRNRMQILLAQIYRESERYEEARELIMSELNDPDNEEIGGALELEFGLLYLAEGDYESAKSRLSQVTEMYKKTPESAKAYYHLAMLNMTYFHNYEEAQKQFQMVSSEDPKSKFAQMAKQKAQELKRFFAVKKEFDSVEPIVKGIITSFSLSEDSVAAEPNSEQTPEELKKELEQQLVQTESTIDTLGLFSKYYQKIYEMAEFYYFNFNLVDTAISYFEKIVHSPWYNPYIEKSLYALYFLYGREKDTANANFYKEVLKKYNPESPYLSFIENQEIAVPKAERETEYKYNQAELFLNTNPDSAISILRNISKESPKSLYSEKSVLSLAWIYQHKLHNIDSTLFWYDYFLEKYPDSKHYGKVQKEYNAISNLFSLSSPDSILRGKSDMDSDSLKNARQNNLPEPPESEQQNPDTSNVENSDIPLK
jgi:outer membrane protein assembly factor BamD (BamD/ComL family)